MEKVPQQEQPSPSLLPHPTPPLEAFPSWLSLWWPLSLYVELGNGYVGKSWSLGDGDPDGFSRGCCCVIVAMALALCAPCSFLKSKWFIFLS